MTSQDSTTIAPSRRRPSVISLRTRPRTATTSGALPPRLEDSAWNGSAFAADGDTEEDKEHAAEEMDQFPDAVPRRRPSKSFTNLRHPVDGLRALRRRLSVTIRNKSSKHMLQPPLDDSHIGQVNQPRHGVSGSWDARLRNPWFKAHSINRRPSHNSVSALHSFYAPTASVPAPIPGHGHEPPILPQDMVAGSAARAAAAAQNELARVERDAAKYRDATLALDAESGIGIDLRDRSDCSETELVVVRIDPVRQLPSEIVSQILSYLDPDSLLQSELVSRAWNEQAVSRHVWRHVFCWTYQHRRPRETSSKKKQSAGLGKTPQAVPNQDWKRMFLVRRALEHRWKEGKAAAIYLHGHKDSVYCAQFDEYAPLSSALAVVFLLPNCHAETRSSPVLVTAQFACGTHVILGHAARLLDLRWATYPV